MMLRNGSYSALMMMFLASSTSVHSQQVPNIFSPDTPASAADVNQNFTYVTDRLGELENLSLGFNLKDGERNLDVDCSNDAAALNQAYNDNWQYSELNFTITGDCYGDISANRNGLDVENNWDESYFQPTGQTLNITAAEGQSAGLIENDLSGRAAVFGGFSGGLYVSNLTITLGSNDFTGLFWGRNGHGSVINTSIVGPDEISGNGLQIQEGAQVYIIGVTITNTNRGVDAINNAVIRFLFEDSTFTNVNTGIRLISSIARSQSGLSITANTNGFEMYAASTWNAFGQDISIDSGFIRIATNSAFQAQNLTASSSTMEVSDSVVEVFGDLNLSSLFTNTSKVLAFGGGITGETNIADASSISFAGSEETPLALQSINIERSSTVTLNHVAVTDFVNAFWGSSLNAENTSADVINAESSSVRGFTLEVRETNASNEAFVEIDGLTEAESVNANSATVTLRNTNLSGNVVANSNSNVNLETSEVNGLEIGRKSSANISDSTVRGVSSVVDFLDASIWATRGATVGIFGATTVNDGAKPIEVEALSFLELDFGTVQTLNGVEINCNAGSVAYIPETADVTFSGCN